VNTVSNNGNLNGRARVLMLAVLMVTSTFGAIGTTAAGPSGYEEVMWNSMNGNVVTADDGSYVLLYDNITDVDMTFTSSHLEIGEEYLLKIQICLMTQVNQDCLEPSDYFWTATDPDGDGASNSTEMVDPTGMEEDQCYDVFADLYHIDAAENLMHVDWDGHLVSISTVGECGMMDSIEYISIDFGGDFMAGPHGPHYNSTSEAMDSVSVMAWDLFEEDNYTIVVELDMSHDGIEDSYQTWNYSVNNTNSMITVEGMELDGCYGLNTNLFQAGNEGDYLDHAHSMFTIGDHLACGEEHLQEPYPEVWTEKTWNPMWDMFEGYTHDEPIDIMYSVMDLEPNTSYMSVLMVSGPLDMMDKDDQEDMICYDMVTDETVDIQEEKECTDAGFMWVEDNSNDGEGLNQTECEAAGYEWDIDHCNDDGSLEGDNETQHEETEEGHEDQVIMQHWDNFTTTDDADEQLSHYYEALVTLSASSLEAGVYVAMYIVIEQGTEENNTQTWSSPGSMFCVDDIICDGPPDEDRCPFDENNTESPCNVEECDPFSDLHDQDVCDAAVEEYCANNDDPACHGGPQMDMDPDNWATGVGSYMMHFDQFDAKTDDGNNVNGILELANSMELMPQFRMFADFNQDGNVDPVEQMDFMMMFSQGPDNNNNNEEYMACYNTATDEELVAYTNQLDCEDAGYMWVTISVNDGGDQGDQGDDNGENQMDDNDDDMFITLDGTDLGTPTHEWMWIEGLVGPVDGSDGVTLTLISASVWELNLPDWNTTSSHEVTIGDKNGPLREAGCDDGKLDSGTFGVYDSWAWSPSSIELGTWEVMPDGEHGWVSAYDCDSSELESLTVTFTKTVRDYNADNIEPVEAGPQEDWEQDVSENMPPVCHVFASVTDGIDWVEGEDHFEAPNGDHVIELEAGTWFLSVYCKDPDGDMVMGQVTAAGVTVDFLEEGEGHASKDFVLIAGMPNITVDYHWDSTGGHSGQGTITVHVLSPDTTVVEPTTNDDGTLSCPDSLVLNADQTQCVAALPDDVGDIIDDIAVEDGGSIPGFTSTLSIISMLGAVLVMSRRRQNC